jgi:hypothetical protein
MAFTVRTPRAWWGAIRSERSMTLDQYLQQRIDYMRFNGNMYGLGAAISQTLPGQPQERIDQNFVGLVEGAYKQNGVVFACILARMSLFSEARPAWRRFRDGEPGDTFGSGGLAKLERPWPNGRTRDLLSRMEQDASLGGNSFILDRGAAGLRRLRPDWMNIVLGNPDEDIPSDVLPWHPETEVLGYSYTPGGMYSGYDPIVYPVSAVAHYAPIPDPAAVYRGMSWLQPIVTDIMGDKASVQHKLSFFEGGGTPNMTVEFNPETVQDENDFAKWVDAIEDQIAAFTPSQRRLYLGGGTKATVVGSNFEEIQFKEIQGAGETRICMDAGVPPIVIGASEGLEAATYSNYGQARRAFADGTMRNLWGHACGSLERLVERERQSLPGGGADVELWYADRHIAFLQDDQKDAAEVQSKEGATIRLLTDGGYKPESVKAAIVNGNWNLLEYDPTKAPVQTRPAGTGAGGTAPADGAAQNGSGAAAIAN